MRNSFLSKAISGFFLTGAVTVFGLVQAQTTSSEGDVKSAAALPAGDSVVSQSPDSVASEAADSIASQDPAPAAVDAGSSADTVLIDLRDDLSDEIKGALESALDVQWRINNADNPEEQIYRVPGGSVLLSRLQAMLKGDDRVEAVELETSYAASGVPDDPLYAYQWHMDMAGLPASRAITQGEGVVVAVLDTGVTARDYDKFKRVEDISAGSFVKGYDFVQDDRDPNDDHGHGTHVAATIAEATNNGVGAAGMAPRVKIMPVKVLDERGFGGTADIADAIRYAADHGAQVVNLSLGGGQKSTIMENACEYAIKKGVTVVAAAGNEGRYRVSYPAAYEGVVAVAASRFDRQLAPYSNRGKRVDITAPGGDMRVDQNGDGRPDGVLQNTIVRGNPAKNGYFAFQGTSMASPHVAGSAALLYSIGVNTPKSVLKALKETAMPVAQVNRDEGGAGILQTHLALRQAILRNGIWTVVCSLLLTIWLRRFGTRKLKGDVPQLGRAYLAGLILGGPGLFVLPYFGVSLGPLTPYLGYGFPHWHVPLFGAGSMTGALFYSALAPLALVVGTYPSRRLNRFSAGFAIGVAAVLIATVFGPMDVPGIPIWLFERAWLLLNAVFCLFATYLAIRSPRT